MLTRQFDQFWKCICLCNHHRNQDIKYFHYSKKFPIFFLQEISSILDTMQPKIYLLYIDFLCLDLQQNFTRSDKNRTLALLLILRRMLQSFTIEYEVIWSLCSCGMKLVALYQVEEISFYFWFTRSLYYRWVINFVKCLFCINRQA